jgi:hypothetical protein
MNNMLLPWRASVVCSILLLYLLSACRTSTNSERINLLNGTWKNDDTTVVIDLPSRSYTRVDKGLKIERTVNKVEDRGDFFVLDLDGYAIRTDIYSSGTLIIMGSPEGTLVLKRVIDGQ